MQTYLQTPIEYLKGVGSARAVLLQKELGVKTFEDLLEYYPFRYVDRTRFHTVRELRHLEGFAQLRGRITRIHTTGAGRGKRMVANFTDATGSIDLVWFKGLKWIEKSIKVGSEILVYGKAKRFGSNWNITHPEIEDFNPTQAARFEPVYHSGEKLTAKGLSTKGIAKLTQNLVANIKGKIPETLPAEVIEHYRLMPREEALVKVHTPANLEEAKRAQFR
ncbi:OB-fold nucleic acid binding domain-containing protein, partial [Lishizhenia sp.]|uniref:OB-fold nucleic acid binding domain-containing protein n=1 Tax=Lishizhenia sp. TaxID=2497594 RepID=UPI00299E86B9